MKPFSQPVVFVDVETTGSVDSGRITEIACIRVESGRVTDEFVQLVNPGQFIPYHIQRLTGIVNEMVTGKPEFADIAGRVEAITKGAVFVAHNVWFDFNFIRHSMHRSNKTFNRDLLCTVQLSRKLFPDQHSHGLDALMEAHGITNDSRHRAHGDAAVLHDFFRVVSKLVAQRRLRNVCKDVLIAT